MTRDAEHTPSPQSVVVPVERLSANRERFNEALAGVPDVADRRNKGQQFNAYDLDDEGERKAVCIGPITSRPLSLVEAPADVANLIEAALRLASDSLLAAAPAPSSLAGGEVEAILNEYFEPKEYGIPRANVLAAATRLAALSPEAPAREGGWQPIETAPQDGTKIDLWVHWSEGDEWKRAPDAAWSSEHGEWRLGQYRVSQYLYPLRVTHWRAITGPTALTPRHEAPAEPWYGDRDPQEVDQAYGSYDGTSCELCKRERVMVGGATGRRICEKCGLYQEAPAEGAGEGEVEEAISFMERAAAMLYRGEMPVAGCQYAANWYNAHTVVCTALRARSSAPEAREEALGNLLAVIHGDGGHRALEVGTKQAALEAEKIVAGLFAAPSADKLRIAVEALERVSGFSSDDQSRKLAAEALAALKAEAR